MSLAIPKSEFFRTFDASKRENEAFPSDLRKLLLIWSDEPKRAAFKERFSSVLLTRTNVEEERMIRSLADQMAESATNLSDAVNCASFFLRHFARRVGREDQPDAMAADLVTLGLASELQESVARDILTWLKGVVFPQVEKNMRSRSAAAGLFPSLEGISLEAELRAVQIDTYTSADEIDAYEPKITAVVPVASVEIRTTDKDFLFQADKDDLIRMIKYFQAAIKDLDALYNLHERKNP